MHRPNTVAGLLAKRKELADFGKKPAAELHKVTCDIDHLDAAIRLFDPASTPHAIQRYAVAHRAQKGHLRRFVLAFLRDATEPTTSRQITEAWIAARGLKADDATFVILRKWIGACLGALQADGRVEGAGHVGEYKCWQLCIHTQVLAAPENNGQRDAIQHVRAAEPDPHPWT